MDKKRKIKIVSTCAVLAAISCVVAAMCKVLTFGGLRITFENLPIILSGYLFGPIAGFSVGVVSDFLNSIIFYGVGGINPIVTLGAGCVGLFAGIGSHIAVKKSVGFRLFLSVLLAHTIGNMIVKSVGLYLWYSYPFSVLILRVPLYMGIGIIEFFLLKIILKNKRISEASVYDISKGA